VRRLDAYQIERPPESVERTVENKEAHS
jgi:hypothetical protein